jgi:hypothetical protein
MSRTYFPTRNDNGVRNMSRNVTLGGMDGLDFTGYRAPAEPPAKAAMTPVNLGAMLPVDSAGSFARPALTDYSVWRNGPFSPIIARPIGTPATPVSTLAPPVSSQTTPTPVVTAPATPPPTSVLVTSGGGTASPAPAAVPAPYTDSSGNVWTYSAASGQWSISLPGSSSAITQSPTTSTTVQAAPGLTDQVAAWLNGTTPIWNYNVPNALLAGGVVLGFALLMGGGKKR